MISINKFITLIWNRDIYHIPENYRKQFWEERLNINLFRETVYSIILVIWNAFMLVYTGIGAFHETWVRVPAYQYEFYLHIVGLLASSFFMYQFLKARKKTSRNRQAIGSSINLLFIAFVLFWTAGITLVDLAINQQMVVYTIGLMAVSISLVMRPKESALVYFSTYAVLVGGTVLTQDNRAIIESSVLNGLILVTLGLVISRMIYVFHLKDFIKSKTIEEKTKELENAHKELELALLKRTEELASTNEQLIQEINNRYAMEMQVLKADLEYQKKLTVLNEAMEYDRLRGEFFANISHELRTPLSIIFCTMQMINACLVKNDALLDTSKISKYMILMRQNCYRLLKLINNLIDITKIDSGYMSINLQNHDIVQIVENITMSIVPYTEFHGVTVIFDTEMEEKVIACDPDKIERIILNLLSNAIKFSPRNGRISVNIYEMNEYVAISVKDTGIGIPREKQEAIFDRFVQVDKSITREKEGSGIGLSLVKSLVEMHHGRIRVVSEPGKGSEFIVELPDVTVECSEENTEYISSSVVDNTERINIEFADIYGLDN